MTTTMKYIPVEQVTEGMVNSMGQEIVGVKHTAKQVHLTTISAVDGKLLVERESKGSQIVITVRG